MNTPANLLLLSIQTLMQTHDSDHFYLSITDDHYTFKNRYTYRNHQVGFDYTLSVNRNQIHPTHIEINTTYHLNGYQDIDSQPLTVEVNWELPQCVITDRGTMSFHYVENVAVKNYLDELFTTRTKRDYYVKTIYDYWVSGVREEKINGFRMLRVKSKDTQKEAELKQLLNLTSDYFPDIEGLPLTLNKIIWGDLNQDKYGKHHADFTENPNALPNLIGREKNGSYTLYRPGRRAVVISQWENDNVDALFSRYLYPHPDEVALLSPFATSLQLKEIQDYTVESILTKLKNSMVINAAKVKDLQEKTVERLFNKENVNRKVEPLKLIKENASNELMTNRVRYYQVSEGDRRGIYSIELLPKFTTLNLVAFSVDKLTHYGDNTRNVGILPIYNRTGISEVQFDTYFQQTAIDINQLLNKLKPQLTMDWRTIDVVDSSQRYRNDFYPFKETRIEVYALNKVYAELTLSCGYLESYINDDEDEDFMITLNVEVCENDKETESEEFLCPILLKHRYQCIMKTPDNIQQTLETHLPPVFSKVERLLEKYRQVDWEDCL